MPMFSPTTNVNIVVVAILVHNQSSQFYCCTTKKAYKLLDMLTFGASKKIGLFLVKLSLLLEGTLAKQ